MNSHQALMLLLLTGGAFIVPLLSERIGWFSAPCEVLYGAVIANFVPGANQPSIFVTSLANFGFLLLLFLAGLEIDFTLLKQRGTKAVLWALLAVFALQGISLGIGSIILHWSFLFSLLLGAMSVSIILTVLKQDNLAQSTFGQAVLLISVIGEFLTILIMTGYDLIYRYGFDWPLAWAALKLSGLLVLGYIAMRSMGALVDRNPHRFARFFIVNDPSEVGVRASLALLLSFAAFAVLLDVDQILAAFIAGAICSFAFRRQQVLTEKLSTIGQGFFLPIFFISVGLQLDLGALLHGSALLLLIQIVVAVLAVRLLALPFLRLTGISWQMAIPAAFLLSAPLTLQVAIVQVGIDLGQLDTRLQGGVLGAAIAGAIIFPLLARPLVKQAAKPIKVRRKSTFVVAVPNATMPRIRMPIGGQVSKRKPTFAQPLPVSAQE